MRLPARSGYGRVLRAREALLLTLLHPLDHAPEQVAGLALHPYGLALVRVVHLQEVLHLPDVGHGLRQLLHRVLLLLTLLALLLLSLLALLLLLLALLLLLITLGHRDLPSTRALVST